MLFERNYQVLGGSTSGGPQQKKGLARIWELMMDNTGRFLLTNLLCLVCALPCAIGILYALTENSPTLLVLAGVLGGMIFAPSYAALVDGVLMAVRDVPGGWWKRYLHAWRVNWLDALAPGAILGAGVAVLIYEYCQIRFDQALPTSLYVVTAIAIVVLVLLFTYLWLQLVYTDLKLHQMFSNCLLMILAHPLVSVVAAVVQLAYWVAVVWFVPYTLILLPLTGVWLPCLVGTFIVYNQFSREFKIDLPEGAEDEAAEEPEEEPEN